MSFAKRRGTVYSYKPSLIKQSIPSIKRIHRRNDQFRSIKFEYDLIPEASGSVYAEYGNTKIIVAIYGPKQSRYSNKFSNDATFECNFHYAPFAFDQRLTESRGKSIKEKDIALNIEKALKNVILLNKYPKCIIEAHVWLLQCDGNTLSCSINTTCLALVDAGIEMKDFVTSSQIIYYKDDEDNNLFLIDATLNEERYIYKECEMMVSFMNETKEITLLNMNGSLPPNECKKALTLCLNGCYQLKLLMKKSLFQQMMNKV